MAAKTGSKDTLPAVKDGGFPGVGDHLEGIEFVSFDENIHSIYDDLAECQGGLQWV